MFVRELPTMLPPWDNSLTNMLHPIYRKNDTLGLNSCDGFFQPFFHVAQCALHSIMIPYCCMKFNDKWRHSYFANATILILYLLGKRSTLLFNPPKISYKCHELSFSKLFKELQPQKSSLKLGLCIC